MRKLTKQEQEIIYDACDLYGFVVIKYYEEKNIMILFYETNNGVKVAGFNACSYLSERIKGFKWKPMSVPEWNKRYPMPDLKFVFSIRNWGEGVL